MTPMRKANPSQAIVTPLRPGKRKYQKKAPLQNGGTLYQEPEGSGGIT